MSIFEPLFSKLKLDPPRNKSKSVLINLSNIYKFVYNRRLNEERLETDGFETNLTDRELEDDFIQSGGVEIITSLLKIKEVVQAHAKIVTPEMSKLTLLFKGTKSGLALRNLRHLAIVEDARDIFLKNGVLETFIGVLDKNQEEDFVLFSAVLGIANLIGTSEKKEDSNLIASANILEIVLKTLKTEFFKIFTAPFEVTLPSVRLLSVNDKNKVELVKNGIIPICMSKLDRIKKNDETLREMLTLWLNLAMLTENLAILISEGVPNTLKELKKAPKTNTEHKKLIDQILWKLDGEKSSGGETQSLSKQTSEFHIMLSYNWDHQAIIVKLANRLKAEGYKVWLDLDQMTGSSVETMALAVENSKVILVCLSRKYKESANCRLEGEYAFRRRKAIIPVKVQKDYDPDGWLGAIIGTKIYYSLADSESLETTVSGILKELKNLSLSPVSGLQLEGQQGELKGKLVEEINNNPVKVQSQPIEGKLSEEVKGQPEVVGTHPVEMKRDGKGLPEEVNKVDVKSHPVEGNVISKEVKSQIVVKDQPVEEKSLPEGVKSQQIEVNSQQMEVKSLPVKEKSLLEEGNSLTEEVKGQPVEVKKSPVEVKGQFVKEKGHVDSLEIIPTSHTHSSKKASENWDCAQVASWLVSIGLGAYCDIFTRHRMNGKALRQFAHLLKAVPSAAWEHPFMSSVFGATLGDGLCFLSEIEKKFSYFLGVHLSLVVSLLG